MLRPQFIANIASLEPTLYFLIGRLVHDDTLPWRNAGRHDRDKRRTRRLLGIVESILGRDQLRWHWHVGLQG